MSLLAKAARLALGLGIAIAVATACGDEETAAIDDLDAATNEPPAARGRCPEAGPLEGTVCYLPEGTTCLYGACGAPLAACRGGYWTYSSIEHRPPCPTKQPDLEQACPACWPAGATCSYDPCGEGGLNVGIASCELDIDSGLVVWTVALRPCSDGGADVQVDQ